MADYSDPKRGTAYRFTLSLFARSDNQIKTAPTLAAGDVKVSKDNGATANITTLPSEAPASSGILQVDLSATEMTADLVTVIFRDAAGAEWNDVAVHIATGVRQMADLAYPATSGRSMVVDASGLVDANTVKVGPTGAGTAQTARDVGASVLLSSGTGTGQLDFTSGVVKANLAQILGTALTETAGQIAAAFKQFFDVGTPTGTMKAITNVVTTTTATNVTTVNGLAAGVITATSIASDAITDAKVAADVTIASVTGSVGSVAAGVTLAASAVQAIWDALTSALTTVGSIGKLLVDNVNATISSRLASAAYTAPLDAAGTRSAVGLASANLDTQIDALPTNAELATALATADDAVLAAIAALNNLSAAQVNAEVVDALATDTYAEPGQGTPGATISLATKINYLYAALRNKSTVTATEHKIFADDGTTVIVKRTLSDDATTFSSTELATGP